MRIYLMADPWAMRPAHDITAETLAEWRAAIVALPPTRYAAAVEILDLDPTGKPFPVQEFTGANYPPEVISADGFLVVRTGLQASALAEAQWAVLTAFPRHRRAAGGFLDKTLRDVTRQAVFPPLKPVEDNRDT